MSHDGVRFTGDSISIGPKGSWPFANEPESPDALIARMDMADHIREMGELNKISPAAAAFANQYMTVAEELAAKQRFAMFPMKMIEPRGVSPMVELAEASSKAAASLDRFHRAIMNADGSLVLNLEPEPVPFEQRRRRRIMTQGLRKVGS